MQHAVRHPIVGRVTAGGLGLCLAALITGTSARAQAQDGEPPPEPPPLPAPAAPQSYPTPLQQKTQETYVPQSVAMSGPTEITDWQEGEPIPPGYHAVQRMRKGLVIAGATTFGALYLLSAFGASVTHDANGNGDADALYIPVLGPFIQMTKTTAYTGQMANVIDGVGQGAGVVMLIIGLVSPKTLLLRNDVGTTTLLPVPYANSQGAGLGCVGTF